MQRLLAALLHLYCDRIGQLDFSQPIPGLVSFSDLYQALIQQFEAASYGNEVFAQYVLLPMVQSQPPVYRKLIWMDHRSALNVIRLHPKQVGLIHQKYTV